MEIREVREDERETSFYLGSQAFNHGSRDMSHMQDPDRLPRTTFGLWDAAGLQSVATVIQYEIHLGAGAIVPMGGIAGVSCLPASRGKGYAGRCLRRALEHMRDSGQVVSTLFPFSFEYYDRLGWAWTGVERTYEVKTRILQSAPETEDVRAATEQDRPGIADVYRRFAGRYRGTVVRGEKLWNRLLKSSETHFRYTYVYEESGRIEGYLTYQGGTRAETRIREFVALTPRARRALLGLLRRHEMQIDKLVWNAPFDDLLWSTLMHSDVVTNVRPVTMARIVDVPAALGAWTPEPARSGAVTIAVSDRHAPWNEGTWRIEFSDGHVQAARTDGQADIAMDIRALSQAYFGTPTVPEIRESDEIAVHNEAGYGTLCDLFAGPPMWMNDHF